jgi:hypothetical protein
LKQDKTERLRNVRQRTAQPLVFSDGYPLGIRMDILPQNEMQNRG